MKTILYLIEDLIKVHDAYHNGTELVSSQGQSLDGYSALANYDDIVAQLKVEIDNA